MTELAFAKQTYKSGIFVDRVTTSHIFTFALFRNPKKELTEALNREE